MQKRMIALQAMIAGTVLLAGCSKKEPEAAPTATASAAVKPSDKSVAALLEDTDQQQNTAEALKVTGLSGIFASKGSYTLLAPTDDAFGKLGDAGKLLIGAENTAALAALLKGHILPGYLTPTDIAKAIEKNKSGTIKMQSMAGQELTFAKDGDALTVTTAGGATARLGGDPIAGKGSIALPIDTVLKKI